MAVRKSGDRWIVEFMFRGDRVFIRLPAGTTKADAHQVESKRRRQIFDAVDLGKLPDPLLTKVIDEWLETKVKGSKAEKQTRSHANMVRGSIEGLSLSAVQSAAERVRASAVLSTATRNRRLCVLKATAKYAFQKGYTQENYSTKIQLLPERKYQRRELAPDMAQTLIEAANTPRAKALIALAAYTGMRLGEVLKLKPGDVFEDHLMARDRKHGGDTAIPILPALRPHLKQIPLTGGWRNIYRGWLSARKRAGLNIRYHDLRHMAATAMIDAGHDSRLVADILGHTTIQTTMKYTHPSLEAKAKAMRSITSGLHQARRKKARK
jgi:integrase